MTNDQQILETELYAWVGEDELGSGEIGLKQGLVPAGMIPLVAIKREKIDRFEIRAALAVQGTYYRKKIRLVRFKAVEIVSATGAGE